MTAEKLPFVRPEFQIQLHGVAFNLNAHSMMIHHGLSGKWFLPGIPFHQSSECDTWTAYLRRAGEFVVVAGHLSRWKFRHSDTVRALTHATGKTMVYFPINYSRLMLAKQLLAIRDVDLTPEVQLMARPQKMKLMNELGSLSRQIMNAYPCTPQNIANFLSDTFDEPSNVPQIVVIDYFPPADEGLCGGNRDLNNEKLSADLKQLAISFNTVVILLLPACPQRKLVGKPSRQIFLGSNHKIAHFADDVLCFQTSFD